MFTPFQKLAKDIMIELDAVGPSLQFERYPRRPYLVFRAVFAAPVRHRPGRGDVILTRPGA